jgi:hypothetical protein
MPSLFESPMNQALTTCRDLDARLIRPPSDVVGFAEGSFDGKLSEREIWKAGNVGIAPRRSSASRS